MGSLIGELSCCCCCLVAVGVVIGAAVYLVRGSAHAVVDA